MSQRSTQRSISHSSPMADSRRIRSPFAIDRDAPPEEKHRTAQRLWHLSEGRISVEFEPARTRGLGEEAAGHLYIGLVDDDTTGNGTFLVLDDREGCLLEQLVAELRRVSQLYEHLAKDLAVNGRCRVEAGKWGAK